MDSYIQITELPTFAANVSNNISDNGSTDRGDLEKIVAILVLGVGSFISGMLPAFLSERNRNRFPLTTSLLLCFGAGILLATALVHILPEVRKSTNYAEVTLCGGFFLIYFIDEFIHFFFGEAIQHSHTSEEQSPNRNYGALNSESEPLLQANNSYHSHEHINSTIVTPTSHVVDGNDFCNHSQSIAEANARICHTSHREPCAQTMTGTLGLIVALSLHSAIEGLVIGVQDSASKVLFLLGAVACHKFVMGFCLGLEFRSNTHSRLRPHIIGILVFALSAVCGIGIGMIIVDVPSNWLTTTLPIIQGLAGGTLFYVTVCEVMPREKARWHQNLTRKIAGLAQFFAVLFGFVLMYIINFYLDDDN